MRFNPEEAKNLVKEGEVRWESIDAKDHKKQDGKESIKVTLKLTDMAGKQGIAIVYLSTAWKIKQFCESCGIIDRFNSGEITPKDCLNKGGFAISKIERDPTGIHDDKNSIVKFLKAKKAEEPFIDDDLPFGNPPTAQQEPPAWTQEAAQ